MANPTLTPELEKLAAKYGVTPDPLLPSAGFDMMKATRHTFVGRESITIKYTNGDRPAKGLIYECSETGARRRWGYQ